MLVTAKILPFYPIFKPLILDLKGSNEKKKKCLVFYILEIFSFFILFGPVLIELRHPESSLPAYMTLLGRLSLMYSDIY